ncbi:MAG TPA: sulfite exporter TauE/SafE family protein [Alphaproteobacteria bacterium]|jgi:hypothetical protein
MDIYLPIAEISENVFVLLLLGGGVGFLSGLFGVGGGFLTTPLLIFIGIPPAVAVATGANQTLAASVSGTIAHWRRGNVDFKMGGILVAGGLVGSVFGVWLFALLRKLGQLELAISVTYVLLLGSLGPLMIVESWRAWRRQGRAGLGLRKLHQHNWLHGLPLKMRFPKSRLYVSALLPFGLGCVVGILSAIMGVGGGFIMVPAMIYLIGMPTLVVIGTSLFQIIFVTANVTFLQATQNQTVDVLLALILLAGAVIGAEFGTRFSSRLRGEQLRALLGAIILAVGVKILVDLFLPPLDVYSLAFAP